MFVIHELKLGHLSRTLIQWSTCSKTCGEIATKTRVRQVLKRAVLGGKACPPIQQSTACLNLPKCPFLQVFDAELAVLKGGAWFDTVVINIFVSAFCG